MSFIHTVLSFVNTVGIIGVPILMFSLWMRLDLDEIKKVFQDPKALLVGLFCQVLLLLTLSLVIVLLFDFSIFLETAIMLISFMPSAVTSNYVSNKINGNTSLSITLTSTVTLISIYSIPIFFQIFSAIKKIEIVIFNTDFVEVAIKIFILITLPVIIGMIFKIYFSKTAKKLSAHCERLCLTIFAIIMTGAVYVCWDLIKNPMEYYMAVFSLMSVVIVSVLIIAKITNLSQRDTKTIFAESLLQNNMLGFIVIYSIAGVDSGILPVLAFYGLLQYIVFTLIYLTLFKN
jgi:BASS family bile acid:Na+ symporter